VKDANLAIVHADEVFGVSIEGGSFRGDESAIRSNSNHQRTSVPGNHELFRTISAHDANSPRTIAPCQRLLRRLLNAFASIILVTFANQLHNHLRIRLAIEHVTSTLKLLPQFIGIVESAVVHQSDSARAIGMRMSIGVCLAAVGGPASVGDTDIVAVVGDGGLLIDEV